MKMMMMPVRLSHQDDDDDTIGGAPGTHGRATADLVQSATPVVGRKPTAATSYDGLEPSRSKTAGRRGAPIDRYYTTTTDRYHNARFENSPFSICFDEEGRFGVCALPVVRGRNHYDPPKMLWASKTPLVRSACESRSKLL
jgi:hypothetical protein